MINFEKVEEAYKDLKRTRKLMIFNSIIVLLNIATLVLSVIKNFLPLVVVLSVLVGCLITTLIFTINFYIQFKKVYKTECEIVEYQAFLQSQKMMNEVLDKINAEIQLKKSRLQEKKEEKTKQTQDKQVKTKSNTKKTAKK